MPDIMARQTRASDVYANGISQVLWAISSKQGQVSGILSKNSLMYE
jgi:hypothetical protein